MSTRKNLKSAKADKVTVDRKAVVDAAARLVGPPKKATPPKKAPAAKVPTARTAPEVPMTQCPACGSQAPEHLVSRSMLATAAHPSEIDALRAERVARRAGSAGDYAAAAGARELADKVRQSVEPTPGRDRCPACQTGGVAVDRAALSPLGVRMLERQAVEDTAAEVGKLRAKRTARRAAKEVDQ